MSSLASTEATRRLLNARQSETVGRVISAALDELRVVGFESMTLRTVAARAGVAPATVYNYFSSKNHLVVEILWRMLNERPRDEAALPTALDRICAVFDDLAAMLAAEPALGPGLLAALVGPDPDVKRLRTMIANEINERIVAAADAEVGRGQLESLSLAWAGALLQTGTGHLDYRQMSERLTCASTLILTGTARSNLETA
jgi:AcrR family transcriptional regulator